MLGGFSKLGFRLGCELLKTIVLPDLFEVICVILSANIMLSMQITNNIEVICISQECN